MLIIYAARLEKREHLRWRLFLITGALWIMLQLSHMDNIEIRGSKADLQTFLGSVCACGIVFLFMTIAVWSAFKVPLKEAVYCSTCAYLTEHMAYGIRLIVSFLTDETMTAPGSVGYFFIHGIVYLFSYILIVRRMIPDQHYATSVLQSLGLMISALYLVLLMSVAATLYGFETIHGIYAVFCCGFILYSQLKLQKQLALQEELAVQKQLWIKHKAQYEMAKETIRIINQKSHDMKYQILALRQINDQKEQDKNIDLIEDSVELYDSMIYTGNEILNTVLTEKSLLCRQSGITLTCMADGKLLDFMDAVDLYTLFGNAIDNAIEAVRRLEEDERFISLFLRKKAGLILIQIENRYQGQSPMKNGLPDTTKNHEKGYHGFGVKSIIQIAEKYEGFTDVKTENQMFVIRITLPCEA